MTLRFVRSLSFKTIGIILVIAIFPLLVNQAFALTLADDEWAFREQGIPVPASVTCSIEGQFLSTSIASPLDLATTTPQRSFCHIFKTFNKTQIINQNLNVTWSGSFSGLGMDHRIHVIDGAYDRTNATQFPTDGGVGFLPSQGAYTLHLFSVVNPTPAFPLTTDVINMTLAGSTEPQITVSITLRDASLSNLLTMALHEISIGNVGIWDFDSTSLFTSEVTGTNNDFGFFNAGNFTDLQDFVPPVITIFGDNPALVLKDTFYVDAGATALDNVDGDITPNIVTVSNVDTSIVANYQVTYNVVDGNGNPATEVVRTVQVLEVMPVFGGGGSGFATPSLTGKGGVAVGLSQLSDIEPLFDPTKQLVPEPRTVDEIFDIFARLNDLFAPTQPVPEVIVQPDLETTPPPVRAESFFDSIRSFFSGLFGFLFGVQYVYAEMNVPERFSDYEQTQIGNYTYITKLGLPTHITNAIGDYVANLLTEDANGVKLESGTVSYYFDKSTCTMSLYNSGNMFPTSVPIIKGDMWVVKSALNNTDIWTDISQNNLSCTVTTDVQSNMIEINSTKSDANGTITEIYHYDKYKGIKHTIYFTNNDPSLTNHKFSFSNILEQTPKSFTTVIVVNQTDLTDGDLSFESYSLWDSANQPIEFAGNGTILDWQSSEVISYNATQFLLNGTQVYDGFNLLYKQAVPTINPYHYSFGDGFGQLSDVKFQSQTDNTLDVYIHYANVTQILPVGDTTSIDPTVEQLSITNVVRSGNLRSRDCSISAQISQDTVFSTFFQHRATGNVFDQCFFPTMVFDISSIPDVATPINGTLVLNITGLTTAGVVFQSNWHNIRSDQITGLNNQDLFNAVFSASNIYTNTADFVMGQYGGASCNVTSCKKSQTLITDRFIIDFEAQLESGRDFYQLFNCTIASPSSRCNVDRAGFGTFSQSATFDIATSFLEVTFEIFTVASAPQSLIATYSPTPDKCLADWEIPLDNGGRIITGWKVERNEDGGSFVTLVADTGTAIPTSFTDTTIVAGKSYLYRVSGINQEGIGTPATTTQTCGVPTAPSIPLNLTTLEDSIGIIKLDWDLPAFDGNDPIFGYFIERNDGSVTQPSAVWQWREHKATASDTPLQRLVLCNFPADPTCEGVFIGIQIHDRTETGIATETIGSDWLFFKSGIPADFVNGKNLDVRWELNTNVGNPATYQVAFFDGNYDRTSLIDFPNGFPRATKGAGLLQTCISIFTTNQLLATDSCTIDTSGSTLGEVTIFLQKFQCDGCSGQFDISFVDIDTYNRWDFTAFGTTTTVELIGTTNDFGFATAGTSTFDPIASQGFEVLIADTTSTLTEFFDSSVTLFNQFTYRVSAINGIGTSLPSNTSTITPVGLVNAPTLNSVSATSQTSLILGWSVSSASQTVLGYQIDRRLGVDTIFATIIQDTGSASTTFIDNGLSVGTEFCYRLKSITNIGTSSNFSNELCGTTQSLLGGGAVGGGQPVGEPPIPTPEPDVVTQAEFDLALAQAIAQIQPQQVTIIETIVQTFFEFAVVDTSHDDLVLNSFLDNQRLGIRWSSGQDIVVVSAIPSTSPFLITFEQLPAVKQGSRAVISTDFLLYNLQVPRNECTDVIRQDCVLNVRYEVPVVVNAIINGTNVSDTGIITVDLVDELLDPILLLLLATFGIPVIGVFVQRRRGRSTSVPVGGILRS